MAHLDIRIGSNVILLGGICIWIAMVHFGILMGSNGIMFGGICI